MTGSEHCKCCRINTFKIILIENRALVVHSPDFDVHLLPFLYVICCLLELSSQADLIAGFISFSFLAKFVILKYLNFLLMLCLEISVAQKDRKGF